MSIEELGPSVLGVAWVFAAISLVVVVARLYIRTQIVRKTSIDDYIIVFTLLLSLGNSAFLTVSTYWGLGQHVDKIESDQHISYAIKYVYLCEFFSIMCPCFGRISFALMLLSLVPPTKLRRRVLQAIIVISLVVDIGTVIISFAQCRPIESFWDGRPNPDCWPKDVQRDTGFFQGSVGAAVDLTLATFPASLFWNLNMAWRQKIALSCIMGLGVFAMVASIFKTIQLQAITATEDITYEMAKLAIGWTLEANFVLIAVSIPTLRPILKVKKVASRGYAGRSNDIAYPPWKRAPGSHQEDDEYPFQSLPDHSGRNDTSIDEATPSTNVRGYQVRDIHAGDRTSTNELVDGIRKDITVSVTYGRVS
ncbi:hypothetical protein HIM_01343 [Hirsutella minnesotensis 3608]|nr:hypothetical protein HIM_01343 [Hirsutella minnesotensis 3608]